jgi:hypothetical protein
MGKQKTAKSVSVPGMPSETAPVRQVLTPFYASQATQENPWYSPLSSAYSNVLGQAQYQLPQETQNVLNQMVATGSPYQGDITQSPIYRGAQAGYQAFVEPALANVREQQSRLGALRGSDTSLLEGEAVGRIGEQMITQILPQILADYQSAVGRQMQAIPMQEQAQLFPAQAISQYATPAGLLESPEWLYPLLQLASQYGTVGAGQVSQSAGYTPNFQAGCCFIMLEAGDLTEKVKKLRDELFPPNSFVAKGYKKMARWLVPMMRKHSVIKSLVKHLMTHPIAKFCETKNLALIPICLFWTTTWEFYGKWIGGQEISVK